MITPPKFSLLERFRLNLGSSHGQSKWARNQLKGREVGYLQLETSHLDDWAPAVTVSSVGGILILLHQVDPVAVCEFECVEFLVLRERPNLIEEVGEV
jgi:hypothetical protein